MSTKYNLKLIWDYINGEEVPNIDKLESDYRFILEVMKVTNDKKMYNLCSDEMLKNYNFIKEVIKIFKKDKQFIIEVASNYLKKTDTNDLTYKELIFLMCNLLNVDLYDCPEKILAFYVQRSGFYQTTRVEIEKLLSEEEPFWQKEFGLGFIYILANDLGNSKIITKYFAEMYLKDIFYSNNGLTLEELIHKHFNSYNKLKEVGIKKYILNYTSYIDKYLADYLINNIDLIENLEKSIINIGMNWDNYLVRLEEKKAEIFETEALKILEKYKTNFTYEEICHHIDGMNLKLPVKLKEYVYYDHFSDELLDYSKDIIDIIDDKNISFNDYKCIKEIIKLAKEIYIEKDEQGKLETRLFVPIPIIEKEKAKTRVLKFKKL